MYFSLPQKPINYQKIDDIVSRSAQLTRGNIKWLKWHGVTDIVNLRSMTVPDINFDEKAFAEANGIIYHSIPSVSMYPKVEKVGEFLDIIEGVKKKGGALHFHCKHGADRTGFYAYIYERLHDVAPVDKIFEELVNHKWKSEKYPHMHIWAEIFVDNLNKKRAGK